MNKLLLETLIKIFALISSLYTVSFIENVRFFIRSFLKEEFSDQILSEYFIKFNNYFNEYVEKSDQYKSKDEIYKLLEQIVNDVKHELNQADRILILMGYPVIARKVLTLQDEISSKSNGI
ncbi:MAG: hypothetical protein PF485_13830 [Bacteroidales bacterium]|jgi:hypothetical protein|nr:hypothetical protein [Bacteroidales bacterium]